MNSITPEITVIVPILDEAEELPGLAASLSMQENVSLMLIFCDGGSGDGSQRLIEELAGESRFPVRLVRSARGRGSQMNAGGAATKSELLLFLHADSRFDDPRTLRKAVDFYRCRRTSGSGFFAARFGLRFRRSEQSPSLPWFYYEAKTSLPRNDCIRGDQGFLLNRLTFVRSCGFDESLHFLEDIRMVAAVSSFLEWQLLPATVSTSARRFEREGMLERQIMNAIIVNSVVTGWNDFFPALPEIYSRDSASGRLRLHPMLERINRLISAYNGDWRKNFWRATGRHTASNLWQFFFWLDVRRTFRAGKDAGEVEPRYLDFYLRRIKPLAESTFAVVIAENAVKLWLRWMLFRGTTRRA